MVNYGEKVWSKLLASRYLKQKRIWLPTKSGKFSVKSAYIIGIERRLNHNQSISRQNWNRIWSSNLPGRYKHLLWRLMQNAIPVKQRLHFLKPPDDQNFLLCLECLETAEHLFMQCPIIKKLLFQSKWGYRIPNGDLTIQEWLFDILDPENNMLPEEMAKKELLNFILIAIENIWKVRNSIFHDGEILDFQKLQSDVVRIVAEHWKRQVNMIISVKARFREESWKAPNQGWLKFNCDAVVGNDITCSAWVVRNQEGSVLAAFSECYPTISVDEAEARAVLSALEHGAAMKIKRFSIETDSVNTTCAIMDEDAEHDRLNQHLITRARNICSLNCNVRIRHIPRNCNGLAHNVAKWAKFRNWSGVIRPNALSEDVFCDPYTKKFVMVKEFSE